MRSEKGVHRVTKLLRNNPFREWVTVYFDPTKITEEAILKLLRERRCPRAEQVRADGKPLTVMNPFIGPGGVVQIRVTTEQPLTLTNPDPQWVEASRTGHRPRRPEG